MTTMYALPAELTIYNVAELYPECKNWLQAGSGEQLKVHAEDVSEEDVAGVQLLLSLHNSLDKQHKRLQLVRPSQSLRDACIALGAGVLMADTPLQGDRP